MSAYQFMSDSPWLTFFLAYLAAWLTFKIYNCTVRHLNIRKHGWPPAHLDADGDFKPERKS